MESPTDAIITDPAAPPHVRFVEAAEQSLAWLTIAALAIGEDGELHPAASAALEAAHASIAAMVRAELADPWWKGASPPVAELILPPTPVEVARDTRIGS